jgi:hypothetical protein
MSVVNFRRPGQRADNKNTGRDRYDSDGYGRGDAQDRDSGYGRDDGYGRNSGHGGDFGEDDGYGPDRSDEDEEEQEENEEEYEEEYEEGESDEERRKRLSEERSQSGKKPRTARQKLLLFVRIALLGCAAAAVAFFFYNQQQSRVYTTADFSSIGTLSLTDNSKSYDLDGDALIVGRDGVSCYGEDGAALWNVTYEMQQPVVSISANRNVAAIGDLNGSTVYLMDKSGQISQIATSLPIQTLSVSRDGYVAAVLEDSDTVSWVYLFDKNGNTVAYIKNTMASSGYPLSIAISPDGSLLCVSDLIVESGALKTKIAFYNFSAVGQNAVDNFVKGFDQAGQAVPYVSFINSDTTVSVSNSNITFYRGLDQPELLNAASYQTELQGVYTGENYVALLFAGYHRAPRRIRAGSIQQRRASNGRNTIHVSDGIYRDSASPETACCITMTDSTWMIWTVTGTDSATSGEF